MNLQLKPRGSRGEFWRNYWKVGKSTSQAANYFILALIGRTIMLWDLGEV